VARSEFGVTVTRTRGRATRSPSLSSLSILAKRDVPPQGAPRRGLVDRPATVPEAEQAGAAQCRGERVRGVGRAPRKADRFGDLAPGVERRVVPSRRLRVGRGVEAGLARAAGAPRLERRGGGARRRPHSARRRARRFARRRARATEDGRAGGARRGRHRGGRASFGARRVPPSRAPKPRHTYTNAAPLPRLPPHQFFLRTRRTTSPRASHAASVSSDWVRNARTPVKPAL